MHDGTRILSSESVAAMTTHLTAADMAAGNWPVPSFFDRHGWGFGMAVVTRTDDVGRSPGAFGSDVAPPRRRIVIRQNTSSGSCVAACDVVTLKSAQFLNISLVGLVTGVIWGTWLGRL